MADPACTIVFDWETTGLTLHADAPVHKQPRGIEFASILLDARGEVEEEFTQLINPEEPISPEITKITGLTDADVRDAPTFLVAWPLIARQFSLSRLAIAHNLPFDRAILRAELARAELTEFPWPARELCTVGAYRCFWGRNPKLTELYEMVLGKPLAQTHRALDDVRALVEIVQAERLWEAT